MQAAAHTKGGFGGVPQKVGKEFVKADGMKNGGLYANIHAKQERIAKGSDERMRKPGSKGAPTAEAFRASAKTKKMAEGGMASLSNMTSSTPSQQIGTPSPQIGFAQGGSDLPYTPPNAMGPDGSPANDVGFKKGGHVTTRRMSTGSASKKSPCW